jgi:hypothetical protein
LIASTQTQEIVSEAASAQALYRDEHLPTGQKPSLLGKDYQPGANPYCTLRRSAMYLVLASEPKALGFHPNPVSSGQV